MNAADSNRIDWGPVGVGEPSLAPRSVGTKLTFYPECSATLVDYAMGVDAYTLWSSVPSSSSTFQFCWYAGTTAVATLSGAGNLDVNGSITAGGNAVQRGLSSASTASGETALFISPSTVRSVKAGAGMTLSTASDVVTIKAAPHVAFRLASNVVSTTVNPGQVSSGSIALQAGRTTNSVYTFTFSTAHPSGANYMVTATPNTALISTAFYVCTAKVESSPSFSVWCRTAANAIIDGDFFVHTVP